MIDEKWRERLALLRERFLKFACDPPFLTCRLFHFADGSQRETPSIGVPVGFPLAANTDWSIYEMGGVVPVLNIGNQPRLGDDAFRIEPGSTRAVSFYGPAERNDAFHGLAEHMGVLIREVPYEFLGNVSKNSLRADKAWQRWTWAVFDLVWSSKYRWEKTRQFLWHQGPKGLLTVPRDEAAAVMAQGTGVLRHFGFPDNWEQTVATRFSSVISDMFDASAHATDVMLSHVGQLPNRSETAQPENAPDEKDHIKAPILKPPVHIDETKQEIHLSDGRVLFWNGPTTWVAFVLLWNARGDTVLKGNFSHSNTKELIRQVKDVLCQLGLSEWAESIQSRPGFGWMLQLPPNDFTYP